MPRVPLRQSVDASDPVWVAPNAIATESQLLLPTVLLELKMLELIELLEMAELPAMEELKETLLDVALTAALLILEL